MKVGVHVEVQNPLVAMWKSGSREKFGVGKKSNSISATGAASTYEILAIHAFSTLLMSLLSRENPSSCELVVGLSSSVMLLSSNPLAVYKITKEEERDAKQAELDLLMDEVEQAQTILQRIESKKVIL
ncbi:hypothetical protein M5K25_004260 [Dendrobium thyrsiflorum]|uniref:Uncharacterized protein n=1 Tax=Dendrobium thyrsiflorum TaxID=117978 RepID=A0ABD0VLG9_DENTH